MKKTILSLFVTTVLVNLGIIIYTIEYHPFYWIVQSHPMKSNRIDLKPPTHLLTPTQTAVIKYDLDMHIKYRLQVLKTEMTKLTKDEGCSQVMDNPLSFWRSQASLSTNFTADIDLERLKLANKCKFIPIADYIKTPAKPNLYSFERSFVEDPPVTNMSRVSNENTSSVVLLNSSSQFFIGDTVSLLITMRDGEGNLKVKGGDEIRVWFTDTSNSQSVLPAKVIDLDNGTYLANAVLAFAGKFRATVALVYSREYVQTLILAHIMIKSTTIYLGAFRNSNGNETTVCSHIPVIPGVDQEEICNLTATNGSPWFCGRPVKPWLACTDYVYTGMLPLIMTLPMNEVEWKLLNRKNKICSITGSSNIQLQVSARKDNEGAAQLIPPEDCYTVPARRTWEQPEPTGYLYQGIWQSYLCRHPETVTKYCLNDLQVLLLGDSNSRAHYERISGRIPCEKQIIQKYKAWHKPLICINRQLNFKITWLPHSNPFKTTEFGWAGINWITASNVAIDQVPSTGSYLIHLNHYLHLTSSHISAYVEIMTSIKESLVRLFERNPNVFVVLQGPHVVWWFGVTNSYHMGDTLRRYYIAIQYEIFKDLRDRVFHVPTTDMTISIENSQPHPHINPQITDFVTGFFCGRH